MWTTLCQVLKNCLTENDGVTYCPIRLIGFPGSAAATVLYLIAGVIALFQGTFKFQEFGNGLAAVAATWTLLGCGVAAKAMTDK